MSFIGANARLLSNDVLAKWLLENFPFRIHLAPDFPFYPITGDKLRYANTGVLTPGASIDPCATIPEDTKLPDDPNREFHFAELATHFRVAYTAQDIFSSNVNEQVSVQLSLAIRELLYKFWTLFERGDRTANPTEFDGLEKLVAAANTFDLLCNELTLEDLDRAIEAVRANDGRCVDIYTSSIGKRAIDAAHWVRGLEPIYEEVDVPCPTGGTRREKVLVFNGARVYVNDLNKVFDATSSCPGTLIAPADIAQYEKDHPDAKLATNIWFLIRGENHLHGLAPASLGNSMFVTRSTILADESCLVYHVTMPVGIALGSQSALAGILNATQPVAPTPQGTVGPAVAGQVAFFSAPTTVVGDPGLTYDPTTDILSVGTAILNGQGSAASPSYSFTVEPGTGLFRQAAGAIGFSVLGVERLRIASDQVLHRDGTAALPSISFFNAPDAGVLTPAAAIDFCAPIPEDTKEPDDPNREFFFAELATQFRVAYNAQDIFSSNVNDQVSVQMSLAIRELLYKFWTLFERGNRTANPTEFNGLEQIVHADKVIDLNCAPLNLEVLDRGIELLTSNDGRCPVIFTSEIGKRWIHASYWTRGLSAPYRTMTFPSPTGGTCTQEVLLFGGAPVFVNGLNKVFDATASCPGTLIPPEDVPTYEKVHPGAKLVSSIWLMILGQGALHGMNPASLGQSMFVTRSVILPNESCLVYHVTYPTGIALGSVSALVQIKNAAQPTQPIVMDGPIEVVNA
jgi:hypothetical protein